MNKNPAQSYANPVVERNVAYYANPDTRSAKNGRDKVGWFPCLIVRHNRQGKTALTQPQLQLISYYGLPLPDISAIHCRRANTPRPSIFFVVLMSELLAPNTL
ncbi:hypothetical protein ACH42_00275 [Endozoicomonas sp. (ex Bugula neritina AB1)]|nr:hypothetical protein ACH42_00275 [Endozoicomonas sp. (ex Bugula neritina AB1)]